MQIDEPTRHFMTFTLDGQEYGIDLLVVREVKGWTEAISIPNAPPSVRGVINLRGVVVPIIDLRARFGADRTIPTKTHVMIIVSTLGRTSGLLVDAVSDIVAVADSSIRPVPEMGAQGNDDVLDGFITSAERVVMLMSVPRLLAAG